VSFDQYVDRNCPFDAVAFFCAADAFDLKGCIGNAAGLRKRQKGEAFTGLADEDVHIPFPVRVGDVVDARADPSEAVVAGHDQAGGHRCMFGFGARMGTVFAVESDVENRSEFMLECERLAHQLFAASVMIDDGKNREGLFALKQHGIGVRHDVAHSFVVVACGD
jgi:hypothetical protein